MLRSQLAGMGMLSIKGILRIRICEKLRYGNTGWILLYKKYSKTFYSLHYEKFADGIVKCIEEEIPFDLPEGWAWCRLKSITTIQSSKRVFEKDYVDDGIPFYRSKEIGDLSRNENIRSQLFITEEHYLELKMKYGTPKRGDILITSVGSIGNTWICDGRQFYYKDGNITQIVANSFFVSEYVQLFLKTNFFFEQVGKTVSGSAYNALTIEKLKNILFALPPYDEQQHIVDALIPYNRLIEITESNKKDILQLINDAKSKILDLAIRGQLVPQNPDDEPASVLLERIRAEKEELIKQGKIKRDKKESIIFKSEDNSYYEKIGDKTENINTEIPFDLPEDWEFVRLKEIWELISGRDLSPSEYNADGIGIPYITGASNFSNGKVELVRWTASPQVLTEIGDLLLTCKGTIGEMAFNDFGAGHIARQIMAIRNIYDLNSKYLEICMEFYIQKIKESAKGLIPGISREDILNLILPIPPEQYQTQVVHQVEKINRILSSIEKSLS